MSIADSQSRWLPVGLWALALIAYALALPVVGDRTQSQLTLTIWTLAPLIATIECFRTAARIEGATRVAWQALGLACACRLFGHLLWEYFRSVGGLTNPIYNIVGQIVYVAYTLLILKAVASLPESRNETRFTPEHLGNLSLIACCFAVTVVITLLEPIAQSTLSRTRITVAFVDAVLAVAMFFTALYYLWSYRWGASWVSMLLVVGGTCAYSVGNFLYAPDMLAGEQGVSTPATLSWVLTFILFAQAARERRHALGRELAADSALFDREHLLEAIVPALLIVILVIVGFLAGTQLTPRVMLVAAPIVILFAIILGAREAWIQGEAQRLTAQLQDANEKLRLANNELRDSEARYRDLNLQLEHRVSERTSQLTSAYQELEGFAYAVAHDLKAPLRAIDGFGHLLAEELQQQHRGSSDAYLDRIRHNAVRMSNLIDDLLAYSRLERKGLESAAVDLCTLVEDVMKESADEVQQRAIELHVDVPHIAVYADAEGLGLALRNLVQNALKFTRDTTTPRIEINARPSAQGILLSIADNGIGFDMQYHDQIFKLFHRLHRENQYPGTGIGLALVRKAIERMGGKVWARSREGEGATFYIELAAAAAVQERRAANR